MGTYGREGKNIVLEPRVKCYCSIDAVKRNLSETKFPKNFIKYIKGDVEYTLNDINNLPNKISLLRLDTDWYKSTKKEMCVLFPLLENDGILIVDDYGHWRGSKLAIDEYFNETNIIPEIKFIDYTDVKIKKK